MRETAYTRYITDHLQRPFIDAVTRQLPAKLRPRFDELVWSWTCNGSLAPDVLMAGKQDRPIAAFEFKSPTADANWPSRLRYRAATAGTDRLSLSIRDRWLKGTDPALDVKHSERGCMQQPCEAWKYIKPRQGDMHYPCVPQADVYTSTTQFHPRSWAPTSPRDLIYIFMSPSDESRNLFLDRVHDPQAWSIVDLHRCLDEWREQHAQKRNRRLKTLINNTMAFLA